MNPSGRAVKNTPKVQETLEGKRRAGDQNFVRLNEKVSAGPMKRAAQKDSV